MWLSRELGLVMPAVYRTAPWQTQTATGGDCRMGEGGAKPDRNRNTADPYAVEIGGNAKDTYLVESHGYKQPPLVVWVMMSGVSLNHRWV